MSKQTLGVIFGNRDFFPDHLVTEARLDINELFNALDIEPIMVGESETKLGSVETETMSPFCSASRTASSRALAVASRLLGVLLGIAGS